MRHFTTDDASTHQKLRFHTTEKLGPKRSLTPEGFLLCEEVPIARTGEMLYGPGETPVEVGDGGYVRIVRDEAAVFNPTFIASFEGKPVVNDHPDSDVNPTNWKKYAVGTVINPRRGEGAMSNFLIADLLITDQAAIDDVNSGKREVSCGYDAEYESMGKGIGRQYDLIGNHLALVDSGRCGPRCSIGDRNTRSRTEDHAMSRKVKDRKSFWDRLRAAVKAKDDSALEELEKEDMEAVDAEPEGEEHIHIHPGSGYRDEEAHAGLAELRERMDASDARHATHDDNFEKLKKHTGFKEEGEGEGEGEAEDEAIEGQLEIEAPAGTGDAARKAKDSSFLSASHQELVSVTEILVPGTQVPAFVKDAKPKDTFKLICDGRRRSLDLLSATTEGKKLLEELNGNRPLTLDKMSCDQVRTLFRSAGVTKKQLNAAAVTAARDLSTDRREEPKRVTKPADLNKLHEGHYKH